MHFLVALSMVLWTATFPLQNEEKLAGISQAYVTQDLVVIASRHAIEARALRNGSHRWSHSEIGLPVEVSDAGILGTTPTGVAYIATNGTVRYRIRPCGGAKPPVAVALDTKTGVALCRRSEGPNDMMRAVFFTLALGRILSSDDTTMPSHDFPIFGWHLANDRYGIRASYSGARLTSINEALNLARRHVEDTTMADDETMQLALRAESIAKFCHGDAVPGREFYAESLTVRTCGGDGVPLSVTVFGPRSRRLKLEAQHLDLAWARNDVASLFTLSD